MDSVPASQPLEASRGMLQRQLYVVFTTPTAGMGPVLEHLQAHLEFQVSLEKCGVLLGAGPMWNDDETTWSGEGIVIIRAGSLAEAREIAQSDPMHRCGARDFRVRPWLLNEGTVGIRVNFSDRSFALD